MSRRSIATLLFAVCGTIWGAPAFAQEPAPWMTRFTGKHVFNEGVGRDRGFSSLEWFLPLNQDSETEMWFGDFRGLMFDDAEFGGNLGGGYRWYDGDLDRIFGVNAYWDFRTETGLVFNQAGIGLETLGPVFDFRINGYTPTANDTSQRLPFVYFEGHNLRNAQFDAMSGLDYEAAFNLPDLGPIQTRIAGGGYYFDSSQTDAASGWRARLEVAFRDTFSASVAVQDDDVFGQSVNVIVELRRSIEHTRSPSRRSMRHKFRDQNGLGDGATVLHRLADPVYRQQNIVLLESQALVTDASGTALTFLHVVEGAAGDGTIETPFGSITAAMADPLASTSVVYTPEGGMFTENVTLVGGTRLLSNGPVQIVESDFGPVELPFSGAGADLTALPSSIVGDVLLADNTELSGFDITGGVSGAAVTTVSVNQTAISMSAADALSFTGSDGISIDRVAISMPTGRGILLDDSAATLSNVTIANAGDDGIQIDTAAIDRIVTASNVTITDAINEGIDVNVAGAGSPTLNFSDSSITSINNAFDIANTAAGDGTISVDNLTLVSSSGAGFNAAVAGAGDLTLGVSGGSVTSSTNAFNLATTAAGNAFVSVDSLTMASTTGTGFNADGSGGAGALFINSFLDNTVTEAMTGGVVFDTVTFDSDPDTLGNQDLTSGSLTIGSTASRVVGDGLSVANADGDWNTGVLSIFNETGTGLLVNSSAPFTLGSSAGSVIDTMTGSAIQLDSVRSELLFGSITSIGSPGVGIGVTSVSGTVSSAVTTSAGSALSSVRYENILVGSELTTTFGTTMFDNIIETVGDTSGLTQN